jgi:hypothetical protein
VCSCDAAQIKAPEGSTPETRFTCRRCCARFARRRNGAECRAWARQNDRNQAAIAEAKERLILRISQSREQTEPRVAPSS